MSNLTNYTYNAIDDLDLDLNSAKTVFTYTFDYEDNDIVILDGSKGDFVIKKYITNTCNCATNTIESPEYGHLLHDMLSGRNEK